MSDDDPEWLAQLEDELDALLGMVPALCRILEPIVKKLQKSKHQFLQKDARVLAVLVQCRPLAVPVTDEIVRASMTVLGRHLPSESWPLVRNFAARTLGDAARTETAQLAFFEGKRRKVKWSEKQKVKKAADDARGRQILDELRNAATRK